MGHRTAPRIADPLPEELRAQLAGCLARHRSWLFRPYVGLRTTIGAVVSLHNSGQDRKPVHFEAKETTMIPFPDEADRTAQAHANLQVPFEFANRLYNFWLMRPKDRSIDRSGLPGHVLHLAMMLNIQACRQFRSVVEECRRCEAVCASIV